MSQTETVRGRLRPILGQSLEDTCREMCYTRGIFKLDSFCDSWEQQLREDFYDAYMVINGILYTFVEREDLDPDNFSEITKHENGEIEFFCSWHNGGGSLTEVIENGIK